MTEPNDTLVVGVDIGGTKVAAGLVDRRGEIKSQIRTPMVANREAADGLVAVISAIDLLFAQDAKARARIRGIGICAPGPLDPHTGVVVNPPNVPCWRNFPLAAEVAKVYDVPVKVENDANAAALAEAIWGAGRGFHHIFYATIGTGIGTGIVCDKRIYNGRTGAAGEGGHMSIDYNGPRCGCGKPGCVEILAAGPAIARRARAKLAAEQSSGSNILDLAKGNIDAVTSEMVGQAYVAGDPLAKEILQETVKLLALWLSNIVDLLEPDVMIVGGGVAAMLNPFFGELSKWLVEYCVNSRSDEIPLLKAHYGADAGIAGGAALCSEFASP
ncbi:MAG TPA: ROK family protein [Terriglobales bacterium]|nr:ROK family protein [Terriglobales bacterium]